MPRTPRPDKRYMVTVYDASEVVLFAGHARARTIAEAIRWAEHRYPEWHEIEVRLIRPALARDAERLEAGELKCSSGNSDEEQDGHYTHFAPEDF